jgi:hypothetical protein
MKVELNPEKLWPIVDALDDKRQFQLQSGEGGIGKRLFSQNAQKSYF